MFWLGLGFGPQGASTVLRGGGCVVTGAQGSELHYRLRKTNTGTQFTFSFLFNDQSPWTQHHGMEPPMVTVDPLTSLNLIQPFLDKHAQLFVSG